jgi:hypothetical protein
MIPPGNHFLGVVQQPEAHCLENLISRSFLFLSYATFNQKGDEEKDEDHIPLWHFVLDQSKQRGNTPEEWEFET